MKPSLLTILSLVLSGANVFAQMKFTPDNVNPANAGTATTVSNGILINLSTNSSFGFIFSDDLEVSATTKEFYVTLVCANTAVSYGIASGDATILRNASQAALELVDVPPTYTGYHDVYYPGRPVKGKTATSYISSIGETLRWSLTKPSPLMEVRVRDMQGNHLMGTPINPGGTRTGYPYPIFGYATPPRFLFEVLNCGQAKFCVQTELQYLANPGKCDNGATTSASCAAAPTSCSNSYLVCSGSTPLVEYSGICVASCPAGRIETSGNYCQICMSECNSCHYRNVNYCVGCSDPTKFLANNICFSICPSDVAYSYLGRCWPQCPPDAPYSFNKTCFKTCPSGTYANSTSTCAACKSPCKECSGSAIRCTSCDRTVPFLGYNGICVETCPAENPNVYNGSCRAYCPNFAPYVYNNTCFSSCPTAAPNLFNGTCYATCPSTAPYAENGTCYTTCPGTVPYGYNKSCYVACPAVAPKAFSNVCCSTCPSVAQYHYNGLCHATCSSAAPYVYNETCYSGCPAAAPYAYESTCYVTCPSGTASGNSTNTCSTITETASESFSTEMIIGLCVGAPIAAAVIGFSLYFLRKWVKLRKFTQKKTGSMLKTESTARKSPYLQS